VKHGVERTRRVLLLAAGGLWAGARPAVAAEPAPSVSPAAAAAPAGSPAQPQNASGLRPIRVALAAPHSLYHLPLLLADQLGYFRHAGLHLAWLALPSGAQALAALQAGQADVLSGAFEHSLHSAAQGLPVQAFFMFARTPQISLGISSRLQGPLSEGQLNLRELRVGITALASGTHGVAAQWLMQAGVAPDQARFVEVGAGPAAAEALRTGQIDVLCNPDPQMNGLEQRGDLRLLAETRSLSGTRKLFGGLVPGACLQSRLSVLMRQAPMVQALCDGLAQSLRWLQTAGPTDILRTVPSTGWMGDRAVYLGAFERLRETYVTDGRLDEQAVGLAWEHHQRLQGQRGGLQAPRARPFTNEFALRATATRRPQSLRARLP